MKSKILKFLTIILAIILINCKDEVSTCACGIEKVLENMEWLKVLQSSAAGNAEISSAEIVLYNWKGESYFFHHY